MKKYPHPFIVKISDEFIDTTGRQCIVQNLYKLGDFSDFLEERQGKLFEEQEITRILANIIIAVHHINTSNIFHRDLKPQNFLVKIETNG